MDDVRVLRDLAERLADAEMACDAAFIESMLADDAVIMPPNIPAIEGRDACLEFIREVLGENAREFERRAIEYTTAELSVHGGIAVDRGTFVQTLVPFAAAAASAPTEVYEGQYLRIFARAADGQWKLWRVIWNQFWPDEEESPAGDIA